MAVSEHLFNLRDTLAKYERARDEILTNGQSHSLTGSHSVDYPNIRYVEKQIQRIKGDIARLNGAQAHTYPTYSSSGSD